MNRLRARIQELAKHHGSLRAVARVLDMDAGYLSRLQGGLKLEPSDAVLRKLGLKRIVLYIGRNERLLSAAIGTLKASAAEKCGICARSFQSGPCGEPLCPLNRTARADKV